MSHLFHYLDLLQMTHEDLALFWIAIAIVVCIVLVALVAFIGAI